MKWRVNKMKLKRVVSMMLLIIIVAVLAISPARIINAEEKKRFVGIKGHWAEEYINILAEKNLVILGSGENYFDPDKTITRAESVTLLVKVFDIADSSAECSYKDARQYDWFYTAVGADISDKFAFIDFKANIIKSVDFFCFSKN